MISDSNGKRFGSIRDSQLHGNLHRPNSKSIGNMEDVHFDAAAFGGRVRDRRKAIDLTQAGLGALVNASVNTISDWETGQRLPGDPATIVRLAAALKTSADYLLIGLEVSGVSWIVDGLHGVIDDMEDLLMGAKEVQRGSIPEQTKREQDLAAIRAYYAAKEQAPAESRITPPRKSKEA